MFNSVNKVFYFTIGHQNRKVLSEQDMPTQNVGNWGSLEVAKPRI